MQPRWRQRGEERSGGHEKSGGGGCGREKKWRVEENGSLDLENGGGERGWVGPLSKFNSSREPFGGRWSEDGMEGASSQRSGREGSSGGPRWWFRGLLRRLLYQRDPKNGTNGGEEAWEAVSEKRAQARSDACGCVCMQHLRRSCAQEGDSDEDGEVGSRLDETAGEHGGVGGKEGTCIREGERQGQRQDGASKEEKKRLGRVGKCV
eukprot:1142734-Pelagomonas_calceolata.AAC.1